MRLTISVTLKLFMLVAGVVMCAAVAVSFVYAVESKRILTEYVMKDLQQETDFFRYPLQARFEQIHEDLEFLIGMKEVRTPLKNAQGATHVLASLLNTTSFYRRIAVLDVDSGSILAEAGHRRDGNETIYGKMLISAPTLARGQIEYSALRLQRNTDGTVSIPHTLLLDAYAALPAEQGLPPVVIMLEIDFGMVLSNIQQTFAMDDAIFITSPKGDYLIHSDPAKLYAGELGHDSRIQHDYPTLPSQLSQAPRGGRPSCPTATMARCWLTAGSRMTSKALSIILNSGRIFLPADIESDCRHHLDRFPDEPWDNLRGAGRWLFPAALPDTAAESHIGSGGALPRRRKSGQPADPVAGRNRIAGA